MEGWLLVRTIVGLVATQLIIVAPAHAQTEPTKEQCVAANEAAQTLRQAGKLAAAGEQLRVCFASSCPSVLRDDCSQRLDEIQRIQPSFVFEAKDATGHDVSAVKVDVDGRLLVDHLDGTAVAVDPGEHTFTFVTADQRTVTQRILVREGEKSRHQLVVVPSAFAAATLVESPQAHSTMSSLRLAGIVFAGVGLAGIATGAIAGGVATSTWSRAKSECDPYNLASCADHAAAVADQASASNAATVADIGLIAGAAFVAGGIALFFLAPSTHTRSSALRLVPSFAGRSGGMTLYGSF